MTKSNTEQCVDMVREFAIVFDQPAFARPEDVPGHICRLRSALIKEEHTEYRNTEPKTVDELDAICDLLYVTIGGALAANVEIRPFTSYQMPLALVVHQLSIDPEVDFVTAEFDSLFPCPKRLFRGLNRLTALLLDIGKVQGYRIMEAFEAVHRNNMEKLWTAPSENPLHTSKKKGNKWLVSNESGKVIKPANHTKVNLAPFVIS